MVMIPSQFIDVFNQFGTKLPDFTIFMIKLHNYPSIIGGLGLIGVLLIQLNHHPIGWLLIGVVTTILFAAIVLTIIAMYLPIITMGEV